MFYVSEVRANVHYPCFFLEPYDWDDYHFKTEFILIYCPSKNETPIRIGFIKIIYKQLKIQDGHNDAWVSDILQTPFEELSEDFVSLGQEKSFYINMHNYLGKAYAEEYLIKLRDCAFNRDFLNGFPQYLIRDSLCRSIYAEKMLVEGRFIIREQDKDSVLHFNYTFTPAYNTDNKVNIKFDFDKKDKYFNNSVYCLIGENGVGKTQILRQLPLFICKNGIEFNRIIHISNNLYEQPNKMTGERRPEYQYLGIMTEHKNAFHILTKEEQHKQIKKLLTAIINRYRKEACKDDIVYGFRIIRDLFRDRINLTDVFLFFDSESEIPDDNMIFNNLLESYDLLSSGESVLLYNLIRTLKTITYYSLFLIDEPEIHLHPNFVSDYMRFLYLMLDKFESYAIIATHSVFVLREIKSDCVYIIQKKDNNCYVAKPPRETLGANAMTLNEDVFRTMESKPYYMLQLKKMKNDGLSEETIMKRLTTRPDKDLDLGLKMDIHFMVNNNEEY